MDYEKLQNALSAWIATNGELPLVQWQNEPRKRHNGVLALLSWVSDLPVGIEDQRFALDETVAAPGKNLTPKTVVQSVATMQVSIETHSQSPSSPHARAFASRLRALARSADSLADLASANVGLVSVGGIRTADYAVDQRAISRCIVEFRFNLSEVVAGRPINTIERVQVTSTIKDPAGTALAQSLQAEDEVLP